MAEIPFERLLLALESTRGTAVNPPTHYLNMTGELTPQSDRYRPDEARGTLAASHRSKTMRRWSDISMSGPLDVYTLPVLANMAIAPVTTPSIPGGSAPRLWTFTRVMTADTIKTATIYTGDPNAVQLQHAYAMLSELVITADATGTDGAMMDVSGFAQFPSTTSPSSTPSQLNAPLIAPLEMQLWLDTSSAIGTTAITGVFLGMELTVPTGAVSKWVAGGPGASLSYARIGREKASPQLKLTFEFDNTTQYNLYANNDGNTTVKARVRLNGPVIETTYRHYVEIDMYGPVEALAWGTYETNRTMELTIVGEYDATAASDLVLKVQNDRASL